MRASEILALLAGTIAVFFLIFIALSGIALGPAFIPTITGQDTYVWSSGVGLSMYPTIKGESVVDNVTIESDYIIIDVTPEELEVDDVIVYWRGDGFIAHRITSISDEGIRTAGDNRLTNPYVDRWIVHENQVIGEVVWVVKYDWEKPIIEFYLTEL